MQTTTSKQEQNRNRAMEILNMGGEYPLHAEMNVVGGTARVYAEWPTEKAARDHAARFLTRKVDVAFDSDLGWNSVMHLDA